MKRALQILWQAFQRLGRFIGTVNTTLIIILSFYLLVLPIALLRRIFGHRKKRIGWIPRSALDSRHFERQY